MATKIQNKYSPDWIPETRQAPCVIKNFPKKKALLKIALEICNDYLMFWLLDGGEVEQTLGIFSSSVKHASVD